MADSLRLFVALELPVAAREALSAFRDRADPQVWRPVRDEALHVTLAFLGHRPAGDVDVVAGVLRGIEVAAVPLALGAGLLLPPRRARVLCAAVQDVSGALGSLQASVGDGLTVAGVYEPEKRPFRAHATVARLRSGARAPRAIEDGPEPLAFSGGPLTLFQSRPGRGGAAYEPLVQVVLPRS
jgi:RNA 2',3'-cyclic 3'-phosphodiesterase